MITYWSIVLAISMLLYVLLDGFDLGVGMLFGVTRHPQQQRDMLAAVAPLWDGNETWLIVAGVVLWGAFPQAYALLIPAFYIPITCMLAGLIFRGVAFEFRAHAKRSRGLWDTGFALGSLVAAFMQGVMVGALVKGVPVSNGRFAGDAMSWCGPFPLLCGVALCAGYALLGAAWIVKKCEGDTRQRARRAIVPLLATVLVLLLVLFVDALRSSLAVMHRWMDRPALFAVPLVGLGAVVALWHSVQRHRDDLSFAAGVVLFICAYAMLALSFWPYLVPFSLTIDAAAAPHASLAFIFWGAGLVVFPLMLIYTLCSYTVFRGKIMIVSSEH